MEKSSITRDFPVATYSFLIDNVSSSFCFPGWNKGRIIRQQSQLKRFLSDTEPSSDGSERDKLITLSNTPFPLLRTRTTTADIMRDQHVSADPKTSIKMNTRLLASTV
ncbi:Pentatricopeptide repeat-containing protein [Camellia lanceoleosa]|uniref:Pentatricopeptide repeat-containing protein n=1 Tax=Camellia lanceoleosa TaxID=1840588 RepID=A0ACC0IE95_9ERIC|nr:Pentatricopeptide repeat-containing protein [Camellia lanceoleosa]